MTTAPDMLSHFGGVPVASAAHTNPWTTAYFVDGTNGTAGAGGLSPDDATTTINQAVTLAEAGDVIYVRQLTPQVTDLTEPTVYTDNIVIPVTKYGLSIIGTGNNPHNPFYTMIKPGATGYGIQVLGASFLFENMAINRSSASTGVIFLDGDNSTSKNAWGTLISNCHIRNANSKANAGILTYAGSYNTVYRCFFTGCHSSIVAASGASFPCRSFVVDSCNFNPGQQYPAGGRDIDVGGGSSFFELLIRNCNFMMTPTGGFILITSGTYGAIQNCYFGDSAVTCSTTGADINIPTTVFLSGCYDAAADTIATT